jgi:hypothetical protein
VAGTRAIAGLAALACGLVPAPSRADGAFPDSQTILVPAAHPDEVILVTNFGLILTEDGGTTWNWSCEGTANAFGTFYQQSPPPRRRMLVVANGQIAVSDDLSCGWSTAGGLLAAETTLDMFVDRTGNDRVLAVGSACCSGGQLAYSAFESDDGGGSFDRLLYTAPPGATISGVESAQSEPNTIYLTMWQAAAVGAGVNPVLARSTDGGATFALVDLSGQIGAGQLRLVGVDPTDARRVLLLLLAASGPSLVITRDGGQTATVPLSPTGTMTSVLLTAAGSILVAVDNGGLPSLFRSMDGGATFQTVFNPPHVRGLAERNGTLYAATDNATDGHAISVSSDEGTTWRGLLSYNQVQAIIPCLAASCQTTCQAEVRLGVWPGGVCTAMGAPLPSGEGGTAGVSSGIGGAAGTGGTSLGGGSGASLGGAGGTSLAGAGGTSLAGGGGASLAGGGGAGGGVDTPSGGPSGVTGAAGSRAGHGPGRSSGCSCDVARGATSGDRGPTGVGALAFLTACVVAARRRARHTFVSHPSVVLTRRHRKRGPLTIAQLDDIPTRFRRHFENQHRK